MMTCIIIVFLGNISALPAFSALPAWRAIPTMLFVEHQRPFLRIKLSPNGNLLGYDSYNLTIYNSNLDYSD